MVQRYKKKLNSNFYSYLCKSKVKPKNITTMSDTDLEDRIANVLCDVLDEPEAYTGCVLAINKKTLEVTLANPSSLSKDYATYPIDSFITNNDEGDIDLDLSEISYVASRHEG